MPRARNYDLLENGKVILKCVTSDKIAEVLGIPKKFVYYYAQNAVRRGGKYNVQYNKDEPEILGKKEEWAINWMNEWDYWIEKIKKAVGS